MRQGHRLTLNRNLPEYVVLGTPTGDCCGGSWTHGASYLGPEHAGVRLNVGGREPLPFVAPAGGVTRAEQEAEFHLLGRLNRLSGIDYPDDPGLRARIRAYETAFGMQAAVPETLQLERETEATRRLYGIDQDATMGTFSGIGNVSKGSMVLKKSVLGVRGSRLELLSAAFALAPRRHRV